MHAKKERQGTIPLEQMLDLCPVCGCELDKRRVQKVLGGDTGTVTLHPEALVCSHCGEVYYHEGNVREFERVRKRLRESG